MAPKVKVFNWLKFWNTDVFYSSLQMSLYMKDVLAKRGKRQCNKPQPHVKSLIFFYISVNKSKSSKFSNDVYDRFHSDEIISYSRKIIRHHIHKMELNLSSTESQILVHFL